MRRQITVLCGVIGLSLAATAGPNETAKEAALRLLLNEVQAGTMASEQNCTLVFADRHFHSEKANRRMGKDRNRKVFEGNLSEGEWNALTGILDNKEFRDLDVPQTVAPLVIENAHTYA